MEKIDAYRYRGAVYDSKDALQKELDRLLGEIITRHAHTMAHLTKYKDIATHLEINLADFHEAYLLQEDMQALKDL